MSDHLIYKLSDFTEEGFPFKIDIKHEQMLNSLLHAHDNFQICYVAKGVCHHLVNDRVSMLTKGDIFSIPPFEKHNLLKYEDNEVKIIQIDFLPGFIKESGQEINYMESFTDFLYIQPLITKDYELLHKLNISTVNSEKIEKLIDSMLEELENKGEGYRLSIKADLLKMLVIIGREFKNYTVKSEKSEVIQQYKNRFQEIINFIDVNYNRNIKLEEIAHKANMSPAYFSHMFKVVKGSALVDYVNQTRVNRAMDLLTQSEMNVTEICFHVGFNNLGHFNRMFKRITGSTPTIYKRSKNS